MTRRLSNNDIDSPLQHYVRSFYHMKIGNILNYKIGETINIL
ncbi:hypothetical protein P186_0814 [Pyrobaculum ferrireducens]|uniref:Uncharacterized protein n=1 Tax=Pyrobaculum ferrireducens TaxID=1104324 RepID=G7VAL9_9CREN|nr:hypothetical protein P186_0814 [Pyrobaculum ferrireducens]